MQSSPDLGVVVRAGMEIGGKYRLVSELGRGAMGTVWIGEHLSLAQKVAIKVISPEHSGSAELRTRFEREAKAAAKLNSRYVVTVFDHGTTNEGLPYLVMELLQGESLEDRIARLGVLPLGEVVRITRHVARGLGKAHERGIVHRDLKPANIFITRSEDEDEEWVAKILDFGIAKMEDYGDRSATKTGTVLGTPLFMSPEQVRGSSKVDGRSDLYALGMVVFNMLTGTFAFEGQSFGDLLVSICTEELPNLTDLAPHAPIGLDTWFKKACARDVADRYQNADDLVVAFNEAVGSSIPLSRQSVTDSNLTAPQFPAVSSSYLQTYAKDTDAGAKQAPAPAKRADLASASPATLTLAEVSIPKNSPTKGLLMGGAVLALLLAGYGAYASGMFGSEETSEQTGVPVPEQKPQKGDTPPPIASAAKTSPISSTAEPKLTPPPSPSATVSSGPVVTKSPPKGPLVLVKTPSKQPDPPPVVTSPQPPKKPPKTNPDDVGF